MTVVREPDEEDLKAKCETPAGTSIAAWKWLRSMIEHKIHHRGRIYIRFEMIRVATPPMYGLNWEGVRERGFYRDARGVSSPSCSNQISGDGPRATVH